MPVSWNEFKSHYKPVYTASVFGICACPFPKGKKEKDDVSLIDIHDSRISGAYEPHSKTVGHVETFLDPAIALPDQALMDEVRLSTPPGQKFRNIFTPEELKPFGLDKVTTTEVEYNFWGSGTTRQVDARPLESLIKEAVPEGERAGCQVFLSAPRFDNDGAELIIAKPI